MRIWRGLNSQQLSCGCLLGVYETYDGPVVRLVDAVSDACADARHRPGTLVRGDIVEVTAGNKGSAPNVKVRGSSR